MPEVSSGRYGEIFVSPTHVGSGMLNRLLFSSLVILTLAAPVAEARKPSATKGTFQDVIEQIGAQQKKLTSIEADFRQEKQLALLAKPEMSSGTFAFTRPNKVIWNYQSPRPVVMLISAGMLTTWYPQLNKVEKLEVKRYEDSIFKYVGAASGAIADMEKYFDISFVEGKADRFYTLELKPKTKLVAKRVRRIKIWIDRQTYLTTKFEYVEGDGDITRYEFTNIRTNRAVPPSRFVLNLPAGVKVEQMKLN